MTNQVRLNNGMEVSPISLGSWNTFSRLRFEDCQSLLREALDRGVSLYDVGYYWDKPHTEILFGHAMRSLGVAREDFLVAEKLWLWDYPGESFRTQLEKALVRLGMDYVDLVMVSRPTETVRLEDLVEEVTDLVAGGIARAWGVTNWEASTVAEGERVAASLGAAMPTMVQLQYNVARRNIVESAEFEDFFDSSDISLQPAFVLEGGILAGRLDRDRFGPDEVAAGHRYPHRNIARDSGGIRPRIRELYPRLLEVAHGFSMTAAQLALVYVLSNRHRSTVLVGASSVAQLEEDLAALDLAREFGDQVVEAVHALDFGRTAHPNLFSPSDPRP